MDEEMIARIKKAGHYREIVYWYGHYIGISEDCPDSDIEWARGEAGRILKSKFPFKIK